VSFNARRIIALVEKLLRGGYIAACPRPTLTAHGLYRLTDFLEPPIPEVRRILLPRTPRANRDEDSPNRGCALPQVASTMHPLSRE
jgi:hypothetical protein